jgi:hypothetical protein
MNTSRETIYAALFALVSGAAPFVTASRRPRLINEVSPTQLPALYMQQIGETVTRDRSTPPSYTLRVDLALYAQNPDQNGSAAPQLNALLDAVELALASPVPGQPQTLGGIVSHCFVRGDIQQFEGTLGNRAGALIPIEIVTT